MKYEMVLVYDVPHSASFVIDAKNKQEALRRARKLLRDGKFDGVKGHPDDTGCRERVYVGGRVSEADAAYWGTL